MGRPVASTAAAVVVTWLLIGSRTNAQDPPGHAPPDPPESAQDGPEEEARQDDGAPRSFHVGGYIEAFWQWNTNDPDNGITHFRGFDNRHNTFTLANVVLDVEWDHEGTVGRIALQVGHTGSTYYGAEPRLPGGEATSATSADLWRFVQEAQAGYRFDVGGGLLVSAGLFLSPVGPEDIAIRNDWNWSRSNLFFGLPFYHTGVRATYFIDDAWTVSLAGYNGWNSVVDNNREKSIAAKVTYTQPRRLDASLTYFTGVERDDGAPEGRAWRHLLDVHATWYALPWLSLLGHVDVGVEPNAFGTSGWFAAAMSGRVRILPQLFAVARGDVFYEHVAGGFDSGASPIFWPVPWVSSGTLTLDYRPHPHVSFRLEFRHDHAAGDMYFGGPVQGDGTDGDPFIPNRRTQNTITVGATAWY
jgi:hypothetical protein